MSRSSLLRAAGAALALCCAAPAALAAQDAAAEKGNVLSVNPFTLIFAGISAEYERRTGPSTALAGGISIYSFDDADYRSFEGKLRFYPNGTALRGFSVAGTVGFSNFDDDDFFEGCFECEDENDNALTAGVELNYQWLLGAQRNFAITLGGGAKRFFVLSDSDEGGFGLPTVRVSIGYAF